MANAALRCTAGMLGIILGLWATDAASPRTAHAIESAFSPGLDFISRWLPMFYVPSLVLLPVSLSGFSGAIPR